MPDGTLLILFNELVEELKQPHLQIKSLRKIKALIQENDDHKERMNDAGVASLVVSLIAETNDPQEISQTNDISIFIDEAISVLYLLKLPDERLKTLSEDRNGLFVESLCAIMIKHASYQARIQAALLLKTIFRVVDDIYKSKLKAEHFEGITEILKDQNSVRASMAVLSILVQVLPLARNRIKAIEAGVVSVLVELLVESNESRICEIMLGVLDQLCRRAEGRVAFLAHPMGIAAVCHKILRVSNIANDRAMNVLLSVFRFCNSGTIAQELMEVGGVTKMCVVVQVERSLKNKEKAREILGLHLKRWSKSPCFPSGFIA